LPSGSGKTHVAAFDSKRINAKSVLYVAHRNEILTQAAEIFRTVHGLDKSQIGFIDRSSKDYDKDFLFASIQTLAKTKNLERLSGIQWDYVVIDEFHHVSAKTYQRILDNIQYKFLLGLTATPFRLDKKNILKDVDNNISYEIDLDKGIKGGILVPVIYNGLYDNIDYSDIKWLGYKYRERDLNKKLLIDERDNQIIKEFKNFCGIKSTIGFCVSVEHCERICKKFNDNHITAKYITYYTPMSERHEIVRDFKRKMFQVLFVKDVFNEGIDFPFVEALLFLRPTFSRTVFFQQLGRGLRKLQGKEEVIVLDFIGNYHNAYMIREWLDFATKSDIPLHHRPIKPEYRYNVATVYFDKRVIDIFDQQKTGAWNLNVTKELLAKEYNLFKEKFGRRPVRKDYQKAQKVTNGLTCSTGPIVDMFGNFSNFISYMGDRPKSIYNRNPSNEELKEEYFRLKQLLGKNPVQFNFCPDPKRRKHNFEVRIPESRFIRSCGSWSGFLESIGEISKYPNKEQLRDAFFELRKILGKVPKGKEFVSYYRKKFPRHWLSRYSISLTDIPKITGGSPSYLKILELIGITKNGKMDVETTCKMCDKIFVYTTSYINYNHKRRFCDKCNKLYLLKSHREYREKNREKILKHAREYRERLKKNKQEVN
jgi:hypothetical protein